MRIIEEQIIKDNNLNIESFLGKNKTIGTIYKNISDLDFSSVQDSYINKDIKFFEEISFILSVITSISTKPRLVTKIEETVIRSEQADNVQFETFQKTLKEAKFWKAKDLEMLPEYVYYNVSSDEIVTYENRFIVKLIDIIDQELARYNVFYYDIVNSFDGEEIELVSNKQVEAMEQIIKLDRKIKFIKNTYFYKAVKRKLGIMSSVEPTNILLKNRLYNYCFKFYKKYIRYNDEQVLFSDTRNYYLFLLLKVIKNQGYELTSRNKFTLDEFNIKFKNQDFNITLSNHKLGFVLHVDHELSESSLDHLLILDINNEETEVEGNFETKESIDLFRLRDYDTHNLIINKVLKEEQLLEQYLKNKTTLVKGNSSIFSRICPICKKDHLVTKFNECHCESCKSHYVFFNKENQEYIYFKKLRRSN